MYSKLGFLGDDIRTNGGALWDGKWYTLADISTLVRKEGKNGIVPKLPWIKRLTFEKQIFFAIIADKDDEFSIPNYHDRSAKHISCWLEA